VSQRPQILQVCAEIGPGKTLWQIRHQLLRRLWLKRNVERYLNCTVSDALVSARVQMCTMGTTRASKHLPRHTMTVKSATTEHL
jgi:hypothetical protein